MSAAEKIEPALSRCLYVVEFQTFDGWFPMCGDAYLDREEAERVAKRSELPTRVVAYGPEAVMNVTWFINILDADRTIVDRKDCADEGEARSKFNELCTLYTTIGGACELRRSDVVGYVTFFSVTLPGGKGRAETVAP